MPTSQPDEPVRLLVVDDEPEIRRVVKSLLSRSSSLKATVRECADGESAIAALEDDAFDIVISDFRMNQVTGIDVLAKAAELYPESGRILITGYTEIDIAVDAVNRGRVSGFVRKPWDSRQFLTLIECLAQDVRSGATKPPDAAGIVPAPPPATGTRIAPGLAVPKHGHANGSRTLRQELEEVERQMRQLRVKFGIGSLSAEGFRKISDDLRKRRAQLEHEIMASGM